MDFITEIIKKGCALKCYFEDNDNEGLNVIKIITSYNTNLYPTFSEKKDIEVFSLLISLLVSKLNTDINDPYDYDEDTKNGICIINKKICTISLPDSIHSLFVDQDIIVNVESEILVELNKYSVDQNIINQIISMKYEKNDITVIRNNEKVHIGVGIIYTPN
jgi:hypothetical protein